MSSDPDLQSADAARSAMQLFVKDALRMIERSGQPVLDFRGHELFGDPDRDGHCRICQHTSR
jgi:hypothetical protein